MTVFKNKNIILGICGGIAAYKSAELLRLLIKQGAQVQVVMTQSAAEFVGALTFQALSGKDVRSALFDLDAEAGMGHIELARWADLILIAPASANTIAKIAHGLADNLLTTLCLASKAPLLIAPAMNQQMWHSEASRENIEILSNRANISLCGPAEGEQACGDTGPGRMQEPAELLACCANLLETKISNNEQSDLYPLQGRRVLITAGPTIEDIDPVRYVSNRSSGKMGYAIAQAAQQYGAEVILISGPVTLAAPENIERVLVRSAQQMHQAVFQSIAETDIFIATAAVADYRPIKKIADKIKKNADKLTIELIKNPDILADVAARADKPVTIGFAAETNDLEKYAVDKLKRKNLDMIAANKVGESAGFDSDNNELHLFWHNEEYDIGYKKLPHTSKKQLARQLIDEIVLRLVAKS
ncbi:MAG: bifunctional phosphopantothenoylcysteine decarboxylase/phosphopantothenate--cysteine ligase CoaBC [gamma proteobacterium symbiont of Bathyaustriella thionipta]|nr:bifunctional phosphopantothenoylcysteine decarboxylase/phosphopantothenate--cysteine ligase CoaBC [gamma proteobacterium symbiont of Bathyaustriella thionipta]MCU7948951.1 bifunctional phosphopantothenoylcysteine decarboxylase/phosphopantothenate--cysteine ligase CoaBC [gamma proteobacterium symbiont of Bathyaustriella thionipta]MCU7953774.1 bifunctional phosphopantothenoylcysteine decarboxylase/phosphopantothenate--cysteine ligase CoaBC [gamma proteobacterium symbiont of Bathyaustriella thion